MAEAAASNSNLSKLRAWRATDRQMQRSALVTLAFVAVIIITGGAVRLTGSGLGCSGWPKCSPGKLIEASNVNQAIEQINRLITGLIAVPIVVTIVMVVRRVHRRRDLTALAVLMFVWLVLEAVVGGIVVLTDLHPVSVAAHFMLGLAGLVTAVVLHRRTLESAGPFHATVSAPVRHLVRVVAALATLVMLLGTVVTGTGPHSGDERAIHRFGFLLSSVARVHSLGVWVFVASLVVLFRRVRNTADFGRVGAALQAVVFATVVQGTIGYVQYAAKLPAMLVAMHLAGAVAVTITVTRLVLSSREPESSLPTEVVSPGRLDTADRAAR
jgi:heme a synthase